MLVLAGSVALWCVVSLGGSHDGLWLGDAYGCTYFLLLKLDRWEYVILQGRVVAMNGVILWLNLQSVLAYLWTLPTLLFGVACCGLLPTPQSVSDPSSLFGSPSSLMSEMLLNLLFHLVQVNLLAA